MSVIGVSQPLMRRRVAAVGRPGVGGPLAVERIARVLTAGIILAVATACSSGGSAEPVPVPSGYQVVAAEGAAFAVPDGWLVGPDDLEALGGVVAAAGGDYEDGIPHFAQLRRYDDVETIDVLQTHLAEDVPGGDTVGADAEPASVGGAEDAVRVGSVHRAEMGPTVDGPPLDWVSDHLLVVTGDGRGYILTVSTEHGRDDPAFRRQVLDTFYLP